MKAIQLVKMPPCLFTIPLLITLTACTGGGDVGSDYIYVPELPSFPAVSYVKADRCLNKDWFNRTMQERVVEKFSSATDTTAGWTRTSDIFYTPGVTYGGIPTSLASMVFTYSNGDVDGARTYRHLDGSDVVHVADINIPNSSTSSTAIHQGNTNRRYSLQYEDGPLAMLGAKVDTNWGTTVTGTDTSGTATYGYTYSQTTRFFGLYTVTVPAGTFTTCRFDVETIRMPTTANGTSAKTYRTQYIGVGNGTLVRTDTYSSGGTDVNGVFNTPVATWLELVSDTINGTPIEIQ